MVVLSLTTATLLGADALDTGKDWSQAIKSSPELCVSVQKDSNGEVVKIEGQQIKADALSSASILWKPEAGAEGISFEVKGDGSQYDASVFLGSIGNTSAYEASFPLASTEWHTVTLRWEDVVQRWYHRKEQSIADMHINPSSISTLSFGIGSSMHKFFPASYSLEVRNIQSLKSAPPIPEIPFSKGLSRMIAKIKSRQPLKILLLGDSITDFGKDRSYGYFCAELIKKNYGVESQVTNAGIAGHTVPCGTIVLPRSLRAMPDPDLVCVMFGANDCKVNDTPGYDLTPAVFSRHLSDLIKRVRQGTKGNADILLLNGVPRLDAQQIQTTGVVETIAGGAKLAAEQNQTGFVDTLAGYLAMQPETRKELYNPKDTIHQGSKGLEFIGGQVFEVIKKEMGR